MQAKNERKSRVDRFIDAREKPGLIPMSKMWVEKHRPKTVRDIRGQTATVRAVGRLWENGSFPHLYSAGHPVREKQQPHWHFARMFSVTNQGQSPGNERQ